MSAILSILWGGVLGVTFAVILSYTLFKPVTDLLTREWIPAPKPDLTQRTPCHVCKGERFITVPPTNSRYLCATCSGRGWFAKTDAPLDESDDD